MKILFSSSCRLMKILASFPEATQGGTYNFDPTANLQTKEFNFYSVECSIYPTLNTKHHQMATKMTRATATTEGSRTYMPLCFDASKASRVSVTLQLPQKSLSTRTVNAYA